MPAAQSLDRAAGVGEPASVLKSARAWMVDHDESRIFLVLYVGLAVVLSLWISLFWLIAVVGAHFALELVRQSHRYSERRRIVLESAWELRLDVALVLFALTLSVYMEAVLGVVGLQGAARLGSASKAAARFASWERVLRGVALSADDAAQVARAVAIRRKARGGARREPAASSATSGPGWVRPWTAGTWFAIGIGAGCLLLIATSPWLTEHTLATAMARMMTELHPFP